MPSMYTHTLWVIPSHNTNTTSRITTHYDNYQHRISHSQENHLYNDLSQMLDDFMLIEDVRCPKISQRAQT